MEPSKRHFSHQRTIGPKANCIGKRRDPLTRASLPLKQSETAGANTDGLTELIAPIFLCLLADIISVVGGLSCELSKKGLS